MIPVWMSLRLRTARGTTLRLGVPLFLVWLLALPFALLLAPFVIVACALVRLDPFLPFAALWRLVAGTRGMHIECDGPSGFVFMHVY